MVSSKLGTDDLIWLHSCCSKPGWSILLTLGNAGAIALLNWSVQIQFGLSLNSSDNWVFSIDTHCAQDQSKSVISANQAACKVSNLLDETNSIDKQIQSQGEGLRSVSQWDAAPGIVPGFNVGCPFGVPIEEPKDDPGNAPSSFPNV